jgi:thymidylate kinase
MTIPACLRMYIAVSGPVGCGKSSTLEKLRSVLSKEGWNFVLYTGNGISASLIAKYGLDKRMMLDDRYEVLVMEKEIG